jgi:hypothetical protein
MRSADCLCSSIERSVVMIDSTVIRAHHQAARAKGGFKTKCK